MLGAVALALLLGAPFAGAAPLAQLNDGVYRGNDRPMLQDVQLYVFGGRNFCWYDGGWQGPGYYWCGYSHRRGFGWGGGFGWNGWGGGHGGGGHASSARFVSSGHSSGGHSSGGHSGGGHSSGGHSGGGHSGGGGHGGGSHHH
jgi:hypothetical protein